MPASLRVAPSSPVCPAFRSTFTPPHPLLAPSPAMLPRYIVAPVFPAHFVCEQVEIITVDGKPSRRRRLVRWQDLDPRGGRRKFIFDDGKKSDVTPIRFVCACQKGHLQDINWKW